MKHKTCDQVNKYIKENIKDDRRETRSFSYSNDKTNHYSGQESKSIVAIYSFDIKPPFSLYLSTVNKMYIINKKWKIDPSELNSISGAWNTVDEMYISKNNEIFKEVMGYKRQPELIKKYDSVFSQKIEGRFIDEKREILKRSDDRTELFTNLWEDSIDSDAMIDLFSLIDKKQKEVLFKSFSGTLWLDGVAGSGKTIIGVKKISNLENPLIIVPNRLLSNSVTKILEEDDIRDFKVKTFSEMDNELESAINHGINIENNIFLTDKELFSENETIQVFGKNISISSPDKKIGKKIPRDELFLSKLLDSKNLSFDEINKKLTLLIRHNHFVENLRNESLSEFLSDNVFGQNIMIDEFPLSIEYKYLSIALLNIKYNNLLICFDHLQHNNFDTNKYFNFDVRKQNLNVVYRTTKEIFNFSASFLETNVIYDAPISLKNSFSINKKFKDYKTIYVSEFLKNKEKYIGNEYIRLNVVCDVPFETKNRNNLYILFTRAVKYLNISGGYVDEYSQRGKYE